jgi:hypothetical protein
MPIKTFTQQEAAEQAATSTVYYAVIRCTDLPAKNIPGPVQARNTIIACPICDQTCWFDAKSYPPGAHIRCTRCLPELTGPINVLDDIADEVRGYLPEADPR